MRGLFSLVGLLAVLAIVGLVARQQLTNAANQRALASTASGASTPAPQVATPQQGQQLQKQVQDDVNKLMQSRPADIDQQIEPKP
ncbi:hypothetical protein AQB9606_02597 [Aquabacterium sp. CECT 9606]|nr:hypothetical protein [Aquabacterium sp. CECT 9606]CAH0352403.1 hypothetical protein AQB9606_02597 [Aquabacterium sp. CECT 9606]